MSPSLGIVQGRLVPDKNFIQEFPDEWLHELDIASAISLPHVEWIVTSQCSSSTFPKNPLFTFDTNTLTARRTVPISAICVDSLMLSFQGKRGESLWTENYLFEQIMSIAQVAVNKMLTSRIVLPVLGDASLRISANRAVFERCLRSIAPKFKNLTFSLETDLHHKDLYQLIKSFHDDGHTNVFVTFDTGNLIRDDIDSHACLDWCGHFVDNVHIKDFRGRGTLGGRSVKLGTGELDRKIIERLFTFDRYMIKPSFTLQTARDSTISEIELYFRNKFFVESCLEN